MSASTASLTIARVRTLALLGLEVAEVDAEVQIDDQPTEQRGLVRKYVTPALQPGQTYAYEVRVTRTQDGKTVERKQKVNVRAGQSSTVSFFGS